MTISAAGQRNAVSEGMALGLCMLGRYEFPFDKFRPAAPPLSGTGCTICGTFTPPG